MAEETKFKIWHVVQSVLGGLLVFAVVSLSGTLSELNESVLRHDILIEQLVDFRKEGGRYTELHGKAEETARIEHDTRLWGEIGKLQQRLDSGRSREHDKLLTMEHQVNDLDDSVKKMWGVINSKLSKSDE